MTSSGKPLACVKCKKELTTLDEADTYRRMSGKLQVPVVRNLLNEHVGKDGCDATVPHGTEFANHEVGLTAVLEVTLEQIIPQIEELTLKTFEGINDALLLPRGIASIVVGLHACYTIGYNPMSAMRIARLVHMDMLKGMQERKETGLYGEGLPVPATVPTDKKNMS